MKQKRNEPKPPAINKAPIATKIRRGKTGQTRLTRNPIDPFKNDLF